MIKGNAGIGKRGGGLRHLLGRWTLYEKCWLCLFCGIALAVTAASGDSPFGFTVFLSGVLCVILAAKGNILNYPVGMYNTFGYAWLAFQNGLYGEMGLNLLFYAPMNIVGFFLWRKHLDSGSRVEMRRMGRGGLLAVSAGCGVGILVMGFLLSLLQGQNTPYIDAATNVLSIAATILMVRRYREQWLAYIVLNVFTVVMWSLRTAGGSPQGVMMVVMWSAYLVNSVYGLLVWTKGAGEAERSPETV